MFSEYCHSCAEVVDQPVLLQEASGWESLPYSGGHTQKPWFSGEYNLDVSGLTRLQKDHGEKMSPLQIVACFVLQLIDVLAYKTCFVFGLILMNHHAVPVVNDCDGTDIKVSLTDPATAPSFTAAVFLTHSYPLLHTITLSNQTILHYVASVSGSGSLLVKPWTTVWLADLGFQHLPQFMQTHKLPFSKCQDCSMDLLMSDIVIGKNDTGSDLFCCMLGTEYIAMVTK